MVLNGTGAQSVGVCRGCDVLLNNSCGPSVGVCLVVVTCY